MQRTTAIIASFVGVWLGMAPVMAQSVADVARRSREESKKKKATIVITDDMLKPAAKTKSDVIDAGRKAPGESSLSLQEKSYYDQIYALYGRMLLLTEEFKKTYWQEKVATMRYILAELVKAQKIMDNLEEQARKDGIKPGIIRKAKDDVEKKLREDGRITR
ncbi:MAG: hypothetical protein JXQ27_08580 [Acidobacteria bacterium]|nr:hypothetical protein [Acidobacteriota bacterium]